MKTIQHTLKLAMIAITIIFTSCSKEDRVTEDNSAGEPTTQELLMTGKWYMYASSEGGIFSECAQQSYLQFIDESSLVVLVYEENAALECQTSGVRVLAYMITEENQFSLPTETEIPYDIELINDTELILRQTAGTETYTIHLRK